MSAPPPSSSSPLFPVTPAPPRRKTSIGKSDGALIVWTALYVGFSILVGLSSGGEVTPAGALAILFIPWALVAFPLTIIYLIARAGRRTCPVCGVSLHTGETGCVSCGTDFRTLPR